MTDTPSITSQFIVENQRVNHTAALFGLNFPLKLEPFVYFMADTMCADYNGGYWEFYTLENGGFYMAPHTDKPFRVYCENGFEGDLSADAFGIVCCLYAYSHLSFGEDEFAQVCAEQFHQVRLYALDHAEAGSILQAID